jgi:hypothetical protein
MKVLNEMEVGMVSGGVCEGLSLSDCINDVGGTLPEQVGDFFAGLNELGSQLGIWLFNYTHGC